MSARVLIDCREIRKAYGERPLFERLSFTINDGDRVGLIGPNGAGKSTLLKILAEAETIDDGQCSRRRGLRVSHVPQRPTFDGGKSAAAIVAEAAGHDDHRAGIVLSRTGFDDPTVVADTLSGGWKTRLALACALVREPDLLLLDEPTNHLDLASIVWLESLLAGMRSAYVVISHDRYFLQRVAKRMIDIDPIYPDGMLAVEGAFAELLEARDALLSSQASYQESLANTVRREVAWLRRGAKARTTKSRARIDAAERSIGELAESRERTQQAAARTGLELSASGRKTKRLWYAKGLSKRFGERRIVDSLELLLRPGMRLGVVGPIGSGKSTLLRMIVGELKADAGEIRAVSDLRTVYFDQHRDAIDESLTLRRALAPEGDSVVYRDRLVHVVSWAKRFLFRVPQLDQPVSRLSGGERARVALARLMLQPADLLVLDEPTNDLDISTLEVLEETLLEFPGALVMVSHDRHLIDRVSTQILALDGEGGAERFADYDQWQASVRRESPGRKSKREPTQPGAALTQSATTTPASAAKLKRLSYMEKREWAEMEQRIHQAEGALASATRQAEDPAIASDAATLQARMQAQAEAQEAVDRLYDRWAELEAKTLEG